MTAEPDPPLTGWQRAQVRMVLAYKVLRHGSGRWRFPGEPVDVTIVVLRADRTAVVSTHTDPPTKDYVSPVRVHTRDDAAHCPICGHCTCAMTEASQANCDLHGIGSTHTL